MFFYNLKSALRYFLKQKVFVGINLLGLVIAFAVSSLIMLYVINELKYDAGHKNAKQIYRVINNLQGVGSTDALTTLDMGPLIKESMPEVEKMSRMTRAKSWLIINGEESACASLFIDPDFVEMFTLKGEEQVNASLLDAPNSVLITEKIAQKVFGDEYPVGQELKVKFPQGEYFFHIKGVINNFSKFSSVKGDILLNFEFYNKNLCDAFLQAYPFFTTFVMVPSGTNTLFLEDKINKANVEEWTGISTSKYELQKYSRMYLHSDYLSNSHFAKGNARILYGLVFLISLVVLTACLNFGILSTACALGRGKEIGVRKITGASVKQVKRQVMVESYLLAFFALPVSLFWAKALLPWFNNFFNRQLEFRFFENLPFTLAIILLVIVTATVSGLFTSVSTAKMTPVGLLKKENTKLRIGVNLNKILLTGQMVIVIWFLAVTFLIFKQISFAQSEGLGYNADNILKVTAEPPRDRKAPTDFNKPKYLNHDKLEDFKNRLKSHPAVKDVSIVYDAPPRRDQMSSGVLKLKKNGESFRMASFSGDANFAEFMGYQLKEGRFLTASTGGESKYEVLLNEAAVKYMGLDNPVGEILDVGKGRTGEIIGVVYDFNFQSMRKEIVPINIKKARGFLYRFDIVLRYLPEKGNEALAHVNTTFNEMYKGGETESVFHEDQIAALYEKEMTEARVITLGIILAVFISIMGIFGISLFSIRQRVKEIGVRKINGAETKSILAMINGNIAIWVFVAFNVATPLAWLSMNKWLENFAYKTTLSWWAFALAGVLALGIALLTVSWQSWRAATRNPVEALRYE